MKETVFVGGKVVREGTPKELHEYSALGSNEKVSNSRENPQRTPPIKPAIAQKRGPITGGYAKATWSKEAEDFILNLFTGPRKLSHAQITRKLNATDLTPIRRTTKAVAKRLSDINLRNR